jgi:DNA glycosylase AlkZ-like
MPDVLTLRQLNRATLARQMLLDRVQMPACDLVHHLAGLQAQEPQDPYIGLWSRITDFDTAELEGLLLDRKVVRLTVQRGTVHAVTADDCLVLRPLAMPILAQQLNNHRDHRGKFDGVDLDAVMAFAGEVLGESPLNTRQLRAALAERFPEHDAAALTFACRNRLAFVQLPPRGLWSRGGQVVGTTAEAWLGRPLETEPSVAEVMRRYLAAFGPATVRDAATWSRYTGLREVFEQLGPELRTYRDDTGKEYFDVPDGPLPDPDAPAPVRLLPQYDNVLLSHADRTRIVGGFDYSNIWMERTGFLGSVLVDGKLAGMWRFDRPLRSVINATEPATLTFRTRPLRAGEEDDVGAEAQRFLRFVSPGVDHNVRFEVVE